MVQHITNPNFTGKDPQREKSNHGQGPDFLREFSPRRLWLAFAILIAGLVITAFASLFIKSEAEAAAKNQFNFVCNEIQLNITDRLEASALSLYSGAALFSASDHVSRDEWQTFTHQLRIDEQMPGTQGIGFAIMIPPDQLAEHIQEVRSEGFPDYTVLPGGERAVYSSIVYLEPFSGRNLRAFGYDMFSEPVRRTAMERARDENTAVLSGKVILVQETNEDVQPGALMYVPVYRNGMPIDTLEQRRAALQGWVYSPYRMNDLMRGTLGNYERIQQDQNLVLQIYDGDVITEDTLLYNSRSEAEQEVSSNDLNKVVQVNYYGRHWTLKFTQIGGLASLADYGGFWLVLISGTSISLLLFVLMISLLRTAHYLKLNRLLAEMDPLTCVYNRRKILEFGESEYIRAKRQRHALTVLMIDLNFFKMVNDSFGHVVGDKALRLTAQAIQNTLRKDIDRVGRFGGDEFIIILPEIGMKQVENVVSRLRSNVEKNTMNIAEGVRQVSLSIGAAELLDATKSLDELIERADQAMYADKKKAKEKA